MEHRASSITLERISSNHLFGAADRLSNGIPELTASTSKLTIGSIQGRN